ncbi:hypothetical protein D3C71_2011730 [compost metagenome]
MTRDMTWGVDNLDAAAPGQMFATEDRSINRDRLNRLQEGNELLNARLLFSRQSVKCRFRLPNAYSLLASVNIRGLQLMRYDFNLRIHLF